GERDGTPHVWPGSHRGGRTGDPVPVPLEAGDALIMHPALEHSGSLNLGPTIRCAVYFRLLTDSQAG
ncbi:MAG TPA: phytanoyl-CoA dioxygenase family protein, partial [Mycobacteriales bacterium]|nr:phytanoyl-CoA dioxygenase family protein [Mycobacteriales bacterium]